MAVPVQVVHTGVGLLTAVLALPLVFRMVPMNAFYGVRTRKAFVSEENWFALNAYGGRLFLVFGLCLVCFGLLTWHAAPPPRSPWAPVYILLPLLGLVPVIALIRRFGKSLPEEGRERGDDRGKGPRG
jgi:hypothetical protein